jgi:hypothetical protein
VVSGPAEGMIETGGIALFVSENASVAFDDVLVTTP